MALTNWSNTRRLRMQLAHDAQERARDHEFNLRREVYLEAAEAISLALMDVEVVASAKDPDLSIAGHEKIAAIDKLDMIATERTIETVYAFMSELIGARGRLSAVRVTIAGLREILELTREHMKVASDERERLSQQLITINDLDADGRDAAGLRVREEFERAGQRLQELSSQHVRLSTTLMVEQRRAQALTLDELARLNSLQAPVIACLRAELGLPFDEESYLGVLERSSQKYTEFAQEAAEALAREFTELARCLDPGPPASGQQPDRLHPNAS